MLESLLKVQRQDFDAIFFEFFGTERIDIEHELCKEYKDDPNYYSDKISIIKVVLKNGKSYEDLYARLLLHVAHYAGCEALPEEIRIKNAKRQFMRYRSLSDQTEFSKISSFREVGEFILYFLTESVLGYPMLISKMDFKGGNTQVPMHGSDGIHIGLDQSGKLQIYMGEAKVSNSLKNAKKDAKKSMKTSLNPKEMLDKDLNLIGRQAGSWRIGDNQVLKQDLEQLVNPFFQGLLPVEDFKFNVVCLLSYKCSEYTAHMDNIHSAEYLEKVKYHLKGIFKSFKHIDGFDSREIQFFLLPLFDEEKLVRGFLTHLNHE